MTTITEIAEIAAQIGEAGERERLRDRLAHTKMRLERIALSPQISSWILSLYKERQDCTVTGLQGFVFEALASKQRGGLLLIQSSSLNNFIGNTRKFHQTIFVVRYLDAV